MYVYLVIRESAEVGTHSAVVNCSSFGMVGNTNGYACSVFWKGTRFSLSLLCFPNADLKLVMSSHRHCRHPNNRSTGVRDLWPSAGWSSLAPDLSGLVLFRSLRAVDGVYIFQFEDLKSGGRSAIGIGRIKPVITYESLIRSDGIILLMSGGGNNKKIKSVRNNHRLFLVTLYIPLRIRTQILLVANSALSVCATHLALDMHGTYSAY